MAEEEVAEAEEVGEVIEVDAEEVGVGAEEGVGEVGKTAAMLIFKDTLDSGETNALLSAVGCTPSVREGFHSLSAGLLFRSSPRES